MTFLSNIAALAICAGGVLLMPASASVAAATSDNPAAACADDADGKDGLCGHAQAQLVQFEREQDQGFREAEGATDVTHCFLDIEVTLSPHSVNGSNTLDVTSRVAGLTEFTLDLLTGMVVDGVWLNGVAASFTRPANQIVIPLDHAYAVGEAFQVRVAYHGAPAILAASAGYSGTHGSPAKVVVSSHSQPYNAPGWWPCKDAIDDKFTFDLAVTAPDWMTVASNGTLQGVDTVAGSRKRTRWHESYPISVYLVSMAMTNYTQWTEWYNHSAGAMPVVFYIYPEEVTTVQPLVADLVTMIETLSAPTLFGEYPFITEKYGIVQDEGCCGMEHQTLTTQGTFPERRNVHELAHQWWGDAITCKTWHDIWLNEGFARYAESLWHEFKPGGSHAAYMTHMQTYRPSTYTGTVYRYDISTSSAIFSTTNVYDKGSWVMHMLRHVLGDAVFFDTLAAYRAAYEGGAADTADFQAMAENVSGSNLDWFFQQWVYAGGAPYYRYGWVYRNWGGQHLVLLHVEQYQTDAPDFKMPIDVTLALSGGGEETHVIWHQNNIEWYVLEAAAPVTGVTLDKDTWILRGALAQVPYQAHCADPFADLNFDGVVDLRDFGRLQVCNSGDGVTGGFDAVMCGCLDRDQDGDIDAHDYAEFAPCAAGPADEADPSCDDPVVSILFEDDFDANTAAAWHISVSSADTDVVFAYDYSADGIPPAPGSLGGSTRGVKFEANMTAPGAIEGVTIAPVGGSFSGNYTLTFEMWINANGPFPSGGTGSTQFVTAGVGSDGTTLNLHGAAGAGAWFAADGEGGTTRDYRAYKNATEITTASGQFLVESNDNSGATLSGYFPPRLAPALQRNTYAQQTGSISAGSAGFAWHTVRLEVNGAAGIVTWWIDDLAIAALDRNSGGTFPIAGNIALGHMDPFTSVSDNRALTFGLIDNVKVTSN
jgi:hypothetical protein